MNNTAALALSCFLFFTTGCFGVNKTPQQDKESIPTSVKLPSNAQSQGAQISRATSLMERANSKAKDGSFSQALAIYEQVMKEFPNLQDTDSTSAESFGQEAHERAMPIRCRIKRPKDRVFNSADEVIANIKSALSLKDARKLEELASCTFFVGIPESDVGSLVDPNKLGSIVVKQLSNADWSQSKFDSGFLQVIIKTSNGVEVGLGIHNQGEGPQNRANWTWVNITTRDRDLLREYAPATE